jgi:hypothetical protein
MEQVVEEEEGVVVVQSHLIDLQIRELVVVAVAAVLMIDYYFSITFQLALAEAVVVVEQPPLINYFHCLYHLF